MTRLSLYALAVALAAGHSLAEPNTEQVMHRFGEMDLHGEERSDAYSNTVEETNNEATIKPVSNTHEQMLTQLPKLLEKQLQLQDSLLNKIMKDVDDYLKEASKAFNWEDTHSNAYNKIHEMMEMISNRMTTAIEGANDLMATSENLDTETLRGATNKFMKEVRVQDVVIDALWGALRSVQANAWMTGISNIEKEDTSFPVANRTVEEFIARTYQNLRAAGMSQEDIAKFVPKTDADTESEQGRNMGIKGRGGWGYGGWGYGGWGYPSYGYGYGWGYPSYGYGWGYPRYGYGYWRRLRPNTCPDCPPTPVTGMPTEQMVPPFRAMGEMMMGEGYTTPMMGQGYTAPMMGDTTMMRQSYTTPMMGQRYTTPMTGTAMTSEYPTIVENMGSTRMNTMDTTTPFATNYNTPFMPTTTAYTGLYRNLAPLNEMPMTGVFPETGMRSTPFGFGPTDEMAF